MAAYNPAPRLAPTAGPVLMKNGVKFQEEALEGTTPSFVTMEAKREASRVLFEHVKAKGATFHIDWNNRPVRELERQTILYAAKQATGRAVAEPCGRCARNPSRLFRHCVLPVDIHGSLKETRCVNCVASRYTKDRCRFRE